jgi:hypothetical protein
MMFDNRLLGKIFQWKREVTGSWTKLQTDNSHDLYSSPDIIRMIEGR